MGTGGDTETYTVDVTAPTPAITLTSNITADDIVNIAEVGRQRRHRRHHDRRGGRRHRHPDGERHQLHRHRESGAFSINVPGAQLVADADLTIQASVSTTDAVGNVGTGADTETYTVDVTAPTPAITLTSNITADDIINIAESGGNVAITGTTTGAVDGDTVTLTVNGTNYTGTVSRVRSASTCRARPWWPTRTSPSMPRSARATQRATWARAPTPRSTRST